MVFNSCIFKRDVGALYMTVFSLSSTQYFNIREGNFIAALIVYGKKGSK